MARRVQGEARKGKRRGLDEFSGFAGKSIIEQLEEMCSKALAMDQEILDEIEDLMTGRPTMERSEAIAQLESRRRWARGRAVGIAQSIALMTAPYATEAQRVAMVKRRMRAG